MTHQNFLIKKFLLPDLILTKIEQISAKTIHFHCEKNTTWEVCRKCPTKSESVYDHRFVRTRDAKLHNKHIILIIKKRRFQCPKCRSVFTESVPGIKIRHRTTEKYRNEILHNFRNFETATAVAKVNKCSSTFVTKTVNQRLQLELKKTKNTPWGKTVLIDEHGFARDKNKSKKDFVTSFVDNNRKCLRELAPSRDHDDMKKAIEHIPGKENVTHVVTDMSDLYKNFALSFFPNAQIVVDKFHVIRLIHPAIRKYRKEATGDKRNNPIRHLLLKNRKCLQDYQKRAVTSFCNENNNVAEVYWFKERITNFFNIKGHKQAKRIFTKILDTMALSKLPEIKTLRRTLMKWREEILRYFKTGLTNARIEGFNRKCKLIQRKAYGFKSFENYRLRALYACS